MPERTVDRSDPHEVSSPRAGRRQRIRALAHHEYRTALRSNVFLALTAVLSVATIASVYVASTDYHSQLADYLAYKSSATANGVANVAPPPFALLALLRGAFEYLEIIGAVIGITLGYLSVSRERLGRTLPLLWSRPVSAGERAAGSVLGATALIGTIVAATAIVAVACLGLIGGSWPDGVQLLKLALAYAAAVVYLVTWYCVGAIATAKARVPATGLMVALGVWLVVVLVLPQIGDTLDADNQVPGGLFAALGLGHQGEVDILAHFTGYEKVRTAIEAASLEKHFERFSFAMVDIKPRYRDLGLGELLSLKRIELLWLGAYGAALVLWLRRTFDRQPTTSRGGPS